MSDMPARVADFEPRPTHHIARMIATNAIEPMQQIFCDIVAYPRLNCIRRVENGDAMHTYLLQIAARIMNADQPMPFAAARDIVRALPDGEALASCSFGAGARAVLRNEGRWRVILFDYVSRPQPSFEFNRRGLRH